LFLRKLLAEDTAIIMAYNKARECFVMHENIECMHARNFLGLLQLLACTRRLFPV
jgi:hypothetical protein